MSRTLDVVHLVLTTEKMSVTRRQACQSRGTQTMLDLSSVQVTAIHVYYTSISIPKRPVFN